MEFTRIVATRTGILTSFQSPTDTWLVSVTNIVSQQTSSRLFIPVSTLFTQLFLVWELLDLLQVSFLFYYGTFFTTNVIWL